jgi:hypothetical protein
MKKIALAGVGVLAALSLAPQATADEPLCANSQCSFYSPSHDISCEIDTYNNTVAPSAYCAQGQNQSVNLDPSGEFNVCNGQGCVGNPAEGQATLPYGESVSLGPFRCRSEVSGVTCTVVASGRGMVVSSSGIVPAG